MPSSPFSPARYSPTCCWSTRSTAPGRRPSRRFWKRWKSARVTADRETFDLADDFLVIATQNPREFEGTYPLPESQLDRFMLNVAIGYPAKQSEAEVVNAYNLPRQPRQHMADDEPLQALPAGALKAAQAELAEVHLATELVDYALDIAIATRQHGS